MNERFIAADDLLRDSFQLAANIYEAGFEPDFLVGLWRGGSSVGIADRACMALGLSRELPVLTGDRQWLDHDAGVEVRLFRHQEAA